MPEGIELWGRQPDESRKAFAAFLVFLSLGPGRSLSQASRIHHSNGAVKRGASGTIRKWAKDFHWNVRAAAYDADQARMLRQKDLAGIQEMNDRQVNTALLMQQRGVLRLNSIEPETLSIREAVEMLIKGAMLERLARGEPTEISENAGAVTPIQYIEIGFNERPVAAGSRSLGSATQHPGCP
jgi:hypothetical protein